MLYDLDRRPPLKTAIPLGLQHILAMFIGNIAPIIIVTAALGVPQGEKVSLIQAAMFVSGIATLLQLYPIWKFGARLLIVMGTSFAFVPTALAHMPAFLQGFLGDSTVACGLLSLVLNIVFPKNKSNTKVEMKDVA